MQLYAPLDELQQLNLLRSRFTLLRPTHPGAIGPINAAVMLPLCWHQQQWCFLITRRSLTLRHHPGQLSFPGGRIDLGETAWQAAQRELFEETGITAEFVELWGELPAINTSTGYLVQPYLAKLKAGYPLSLSPSEVESVLYIPVDTALWSRQWVTEHWTLRQQRQQLHFLALEQRLLWGASAQILRQLSQQLSPQLSQQHSR